jgi:hypothetical protein
MNNQELRKSLAAFQHPSIPERYHAVRGSKLPDRERERVEVGSVSIPWASPRWCRHNIDLVYQSTVYKPYFETFTTSYFFCTKCGTKWEALCP